MKVRSPLAAFAFTCAICAAGCGGTSGRDRVEVVPGTLVVDWTVNGSKDPSQCDLGGAQEIAITLMAPDGAVVGEYRQDCGAMATSITLAPESYGASAELLDSGGGERTTSVTIPGFSINSAEQYRVTLDFPANSFL
jgi:hypothetical protein